MTPGCVYFAEQVGGKLVKIGWTSGCPKRRVRSLQTGSPIKIRLLGAIPADDPALEKELHKRFEALRVKGEWFRRSKEILALLPKEQRPARAASKKAQTRRKLNTYLTDTIRFGVSERHFTLEDMARSAGVPLVSVQRIAGTEDFSREDALLSRHARALFKGLVRLKARFPTRRETDLALRDLLIQANANDRRSEAAQ